VENILLATASTAIHGGIIVALAFGLDWMLPGTGWVMAWGILANRIFRDRLEHFTKSK
jgi:hypothetical protein